MNVKEVPCSICSQQFSTISSERKMGMKPSKHAITGRVETACHHFFHEKCLDRWFSLKRQGCPVCKTTLVDKSTDNLTITLTHDLAIDAFDGGINTSQRKNTDQLLNYLRSTKREIQLTDREYILKTYSIYKHEHCTLNEKALEYFKKDFLIERLYFHFTLGHAVDHPAIKTVIENFIASASTVPALKSLLDALYACDLNPGTKALSKDAKEHFARLCNILREEYVEIEIHEFPESLIDDIYLDLGTRERPLTDKEYVLEYSSYTGNADTLSEEELRAFKVGFLVKRLTHKFAPNPKAENYASIKTSIEEYLDQNPFLIIFDSDVNPRKTLSEPAQMYFDVVLENVKTHLGFVEVSILDEVD